MTQTRFFSYRHNGKELYGFTIDDESYYGIKEAQQLAHAITVTLSRLNDMSVTHLRGVSRDVVKDELQQLLELRRVREQPYATTRDKVRAVERDTMEHKRLTVTNLRFQIMMSEETRSKLPRWKLLNRVHDWHQLNVLKERLRDLESSTEPIPPLDELIFGPAKD